MSAGSPLVSIIVPVYNAGEQLHDALSSALYQTHTNIQLICVNDGSTDSSAETLARFASEDTRVQVITQPNAGYGAAMNAGLQAAEGEWVAILEPDDWIDERMLEAMLAYERTFAERADIVKTPYWRVKETDQPGVARSQKKACTYKGLVHPAAQPFTLNEAPELFARHPSIWSALYRRSFLEQAGITFPEHPGSGWADNRFLASTLAQAQRIVYLDKAFYHYRAGSAQREQAFLRANPTLPFDRWHEMADVLDAHSITDAAIWRAHIRRGFTYLAQVQAACGLAGEQVQQAMHQMFCRMPDTLVLAEPALKPELVNIYLDDQGITAAHPSKVRHALYRARFACAHLRAQFAR